jgi:hypothetical protein
MKIERRRWSAALAVACVMVIGPVLWVPAVAGTVQEKGVVGVPINTTSDVPVPFMGDAEPDSKDSDCRNDVPFKGTYRPMHQWVSEDLIENLFSQIGELIGKWISEFIDGWIADGVQFLTALLVGIVRLPLVALGWLPSKFVLPVVSAGSAILLLLRSRIHRTSCNDLGAVVRWTAIPCLIVLQCILVQSFLCPSQLLMLDTAMASAMRGGILAGVGGLASFFAPLLGAACGGQIGGMVGVVFAFVGLVIFGVIGSGMILLLVANVAARAAHSLLLCMELIDLRVRRSNPEILLGNRTPEIGAAGAGG